MTVWPSNWTALPCWKLPHYSLWLLRRCCPRKYSLPNCWTWWWSWCNCCFLLQKLSNLLINLVLGLSNSGFLKFYILDLVLKLLLRKSTEGVLCCVIVSVCVGQVFFQCKVSMEGDLRFWHCHSQGDIGDSKGIQILNGLKKRSKILMMVESTFFPESLTVSDADQLSLVWNFLCPRQAGSCIDEPGRPTYLWTVLIGHKCIKLFCDWLKVSIEQRLCFSHRSRTHTGAPGFKSCWLQRS